MARVQIHNVGTLGIIQPTDAPFHAIPPEAWTAGQNVRFRGRSVDRFKGHSQVFDSSVTAGYWLLPVPYLDSSMWLNCGLTAVEAITGGTVADVTRLAGAYNAASDGRWSGGILGGIAILNNQFDLPQFWSTAALTTKLLDLTNWDTTKRCRFMRPYKNTLVAGGITENYGGPSETYYGARVLVSHPADPGSVPSSWDPSDETLDVIENDLTDEAGGEVIDALQLNDDLILYKENSTWRMKYVGGTFIQDFKQIFEGHGIFSMGCVAALPRNKGHFVYTGTDLIVHDGKTAESVIEDKWRNYLRDNIDQTYFYRSYCVHNPAFKEMWFCFPEVDQTFPSKALTYNIQSGAIGIRDLAGFAHIAAGIIDEAGSQEIWDNVDEFWDGGALITERPWDQHTFTQYTAGLLAADPTNTKLFKLDDTEQFDGSDFTSYIERTGIAIIGRDRLGQPQLDFTRNKIVHRVWPKISGGPVSIKVGVQDVIDGAITWSTPVTFNPATDQYVDPTPVPSGRLPALHIESTGGQTWTLDGYDLELEVIGVL